jgi:hypothetical protein
VEPDRAPPVQLHHDQLARQAAAPTLQTIINLIGSTKTSAGLEVYARLDDGSYPDKIRVPDEHVKAVNLHGDPFHPEWNYTIKPKR